MTYDTHAFDDFDTQIQPEECFEPTDDLGWDDNDENPIAECFDNPFDREFDEGSDRDNWEEQQVFLDRECDY